MNERNKGTSTEPRRRGRPSGTPTCRELIWGAVLMNVTRELRYRGARNVSDACRRLLQAPTGEARPWVFMQNGERLATLTKSDALRALYYQARRAHATTDYLRNAQAEANRPQRSSDVDLQRRFAVASANAKGFAALQRAQKYGGRPITMDAVNEMMDANDKIP